MTIEWIEATNFEQKINEATQPVVIDFWLANCPPCQALEPKLEAVAQGFSSELTVYRLDIEKAPSIPERCHVMSVPTLIFFKDGEAVKRLDGLIGQEELEAAFREMTTV